MNLLIISASQRTNSQSKKVAEYITSAQHKFTKVQHIELCKQNIPLWDGELSTKEEVTSDWLAINAQIQAADALTLITPEWGGTASPMLKNLLMMCDSADTGHKPALLISVVSGISGAYPIAELRMNAFSNNKLVVIPDHLIIRNVEEILNMPYSEASELEARDVSIRQRIGYSLHTLKSYSQSLKTLRANLKQDPYENEHLYRFGM